MNEKIIKNLHFFKLSIEVPSGDLFVMQTGEFVQHIVLFNFQRIEFLHVLLLQVSQLLLERIDFLFVLRLQLTHSALVLSGECSELCFVFGALCRQLFHDQF